MVKIEYAHFDPFNVEHCDKKTDTLFLDEKLKDTDIGKLIIEQRTRPSILREFEIFYAIIFRFKPLFFFNAIFPYSYFHSPKKHLFKASLKKFILCVFYLALMAFLLSRERVTCIQETAQNNILSWGPEGPSMSVTMCYSCRPLRGCAQLGAEETMKKYFKNGLGVLDGYFANETAKNG